MLNIPVIPAYKPDQALVERIRKAIDTHKAMLNRRVVAARKVA